MLSFPSHGMFAYFLIISGRVHTTCELPNTIEYRKTELVVPTTDAFVLSCHVVATSVKSSFKR